jgi:hypothetical protein
MPQGEIVIFKCRVEADPVRFGCWYDRERLPNPELRKGLECRKTEEGDLDKDGWKEYKIVCEPKEKTFNVRRWGADIIDSLRQTLKKLNFKDT